MKIAPQHSPGLHPQIKKKFDFSNDRYAWYWIYFNHYIFNTYEWYIAKRTKDYSVWKNYYYFYDEDGPVMVVNHKKIKKVVCWKTNHTNKRRN